MLVQCFLLMDLARKTKEGNSMDADDEFENDVAEDFPETGLFSFSCVFYYVFPCFFYFFLL
jgi:hypothetical protein